MLLGFLGIDEVLVARLQRRKGNGGESPPVSYANVSTSLRIEELVQLGVLRLGGDKDGNVKVGVLPQREEILIRDPGFDGVALQRVGAGEA